MIINRGSSHCGAGPSMIMGKDGWMLRHLTGPVWLWPADPDPDNVQAAVGVVAGETGSIVVDAGHSPALARRVRAAMAAAGCRLPPGWSSPTITGTTRGAPRRGRRRWWRTGCAPS